MVTKKKALDLNHFFETRQEIATNLKSRYAQRQVSEIRQTIQETKLQEVEKASKKKTEDK